LGFCFCFCAHGLLLLLLHVKDFQGASSVDGTCRAQRLFSFLCVILGVLRHQTLRFVTLPRSTCVVVRAAPIHASPQKLSLKKLPKPKTTTTSEVSVVRCGSWMGRVPGAAVLSLCFDFLCALQSPCLHNQRTLHWTPVPIPPCFCH
jgi:hypothetical protein